MESITRSVRDFDATQRHMLEHLLGYELRDDQQLVIMVTPDSERDDCEVSPTNSLPLPDWCSVYAGLSESKLAEVKQAVLQRADLARHSV